MAERLAETWLEKSSDFLSAMKEQGASDVAGSQTGTWLGDSSDFVNDLNKQTTKADKMSQVASAFSKAMEPFKKAAERAKINATPSISIDKTSGGVTIKAPSSFFASDYYQTESGLKESLSEISQAYKISGGEYQLTDPTDNESSITLDEYVEYLNESLPGMVSMVENIDEYEEETGVKMTAKDYARASSYGFTYDSNGTLVQGSDTDLIALPDSENILGYFKDLDSYDAENRTVTRADFRKVWNRNDDTQIYESEELYTLYLSVQYQYRDILNHVDDTEYNAEYLSYFYGIDSREELATRVADLMAISTAMTETPDVGFWEGWAEGLDVTARGIAAAFLTGTVEAGAELDKALVIAAGGIAGASLNAGRLLNNAFGATNDDRLSALDNTIVLDKLSSSETSKDRLKAITKLSLSPSRRAELEEALEEKRALDEADDWTEWSSDETWDRVWGVVEEMQNDFQTKQDNWTENVQEALGVDTQLDFYNVFNPSAASGLNNIANGGRELVSLGVQIYIDIMIGNWVGGAVSATLSKGLSSAAGIITKAASAVSKVAETGIVIGKVASSTAKWANVASKLITGLNSILKIIPTKAFTTIANGAIKVASGLSRASSAISSGTGVASKIYSIMESATADAVVDAIVFDPEMTRRFLESGGADEEAKNYIIQQSLQNFGFMAGAEVIRAGGTGLAKAFKATKAGKYTTAASAVVGARIKSSAMVRGVRNLARKLDVVNFLTKAATEKQQNRLNEKIAKLEAALDTSNRAGKYKQAGKISNKLRPKYLQRGRILEDAKFDKLTDDLASVNLSWDNIDDTIREVNEAKTAIYALNNAIDARTTEEFAKLLSPMENYDVSTSVGKLVDTSLEVRKQEEALGVANNQKVVSSKTTLTGSGEAPAATFKEQTKAAGKKIVDKEEPLWVFNPKSTNYVGGKVMSDMAAAQAKVEGVDVRRHIDIYKSAIDKNGKAVMKKVGEKNIADVVAEAEQAGWRGYTNYEKRYILSLQQMEELNTLGDDVSALKAALDNYVDSLRTTEYYFREWLKSKGLTSNIAQKTMEDSEVFGIDAKLYVRTTKSQSAYQDYLTKRSSDASLKLEDWDPRNIRTRGDWVPEDYADFNTVLIGNMTDNAAALVKRNYVYSLADMNGGFKVVNGELVANEGAKILVGGKATAIAAEYQKTYKTVQRDINKMVTNMSSNEDIANYIKDITDDAFSKNSKLFIGQANTLKTPEMEKAKKLYETADIKIAEANQADRIVTAQSMAPGDLTQVIDKQLFNGTGEFSTAAQGDQYEKLVEYVDENWVHQTGRYKGQVKKKYQEAYAQFKAMDVQQISDVGNINKIQRLNSSMQLVAANTESIYNSKTVKQLSELQNRTFYQAAAETYLKPAQEAYAEATKIQFNNELIVVRSSEMLDTAIDNVLTSRRADELFGVISGGNEVAERYLVAKELLKGHRLDTAISSHLKKQVYENLMASAEEAAKKAKIEWVDTDGKISQAVKDAKANAQKVANQVERQFNDTATVWLDKLRTDAAGVRLAIAGEDTFDEIRKVVAEIEEYDKMIAAPGLNTNVARILDPSGEAVYVQVDPMLAGLINRRIPGIDKGVFQKIEEGMSTLFRFGTTGASVRSFLNQTVKDNVSAFISSGTFVSWATESGYIKENFGEAVEAYVKENFPKYYEEAKARGEDLTETLLRRGGASAAGSTEVSAYDFNRNRKARILEEKGLGSANQQWDEMHSKMQNAMNHIRDFFEAPNNIRELGLRNKVYAHSFREALSNGATIEQAQEAAEFFARSATTNFARQTYHFANLTETIPYLRASVNGTKSFWRLASLDPAGVMGRLFAGCAIPAMAITAANLASEENRAYYQNIPEYERENSLIFVVGGDKYLSIPLPEQMTSLISPWRHLVEGMYASNKGAFWQLALNDLVGISPVDLQGFTSVDFNDDAAVDFWSSRMGAGVMRVASALSTPTVKSALMLATGRDLYTGRLIDTSWSYIDPDTNELVTMDYTSSNLAKSLASALGDWMSAPMAEKILGNYFGTAGTIAVESLFSLVVGAGNAISSGDASDLIQTLSDIPEAVVEEAQAPFSGTIYSQENQNWRQVVRMLWQQKAAVQEETSEYNAEISSETDEDRLKELIAKRNNIENEYYNLVLKSVNSLVNNGGTLTRQRLASVISLMNMATDADENNSLAGKSLLAGNDATQQYKAGRAAAVRTMVEMGFPDSNDEATAFGYMYQDSEGVTHYTYTSPLALLDYNYTSWLQGDVDLANIQTLLEANNLYEVHSNNYTQFNNTDYKNDFARSQIALRNNTQVFSVLASYIDSHSPEEVLKHEDVIEEIGKCIIVPPYYKKNNYGKTVSLGANGSSEEAYAESFIKRYFGMDDEWYDSYTDKNYSDETLDLYKVYYGG